MSSHHNDENALAAELQQRLAGRTARIGIVGLGYVGLPLTVAFAEAGFEVVGFDVSGSTGARATSAISPRKVSAGS